MPVGENVAALYKLFCIKILLSKVYLRFQMFVQSAVFRRNAETFPEGSKFCLSFFGSLNSGKLIFDSSGSSKFRRFRSEAQKNPVRSGF